MEKIKQFIPLILAVIISVGGCVLYSSHVGYAEYSTDIDKCNAKIQLLKKDINTYKMALEEDTIDEDINYIFEDGEKVADLENIVLKEQEDYSEISDPSQIPATPKYSKSQKELMRMMKKEDNKELVFSSAWNLDKKAHVEFLSSFYSGRISIPVVWEIYDGEGNLWGVAKANYSVDDRLYSDLDFVVIDLLSNSDKSYDENPFD